MDAELAVDVDVDFRSDTPPGQDPDSRSKTLRRFHSRLWSRPTPSGVDHYLSMRAARPYLTLDATGITLTSDTTMNSHRTRMRKFKDSLSHDAWAEYFYVGHTIGGRMLFPGAPHRGAWSFNQARGMSSQVRDRFDLSLECIRRHFSGEASPLSAVLEAQAGYFSRFRSFEEYIAFFLLDDYVEGGRVRLFSPHRGFDQDPLPRSAEEYVEYIGSQVRAARARNERIRRHVEASLAQP